MRGKHILSSSALSCHLYLKLPNHWAFANEVAGRTVVLTWLCEESVRNGFCLARKMSHGETAVQVGSCDRIEHPVTEFGEAKSHTEVSPAVDIPANC